MVGGQQSVQQGSWGAVALAEEAHIPGASVDKTASAEVVGERRAPSQGVMLAT